MTATTSATESEPSRWDMLELDLPAEPTSTLPDWASEAIKALATAQTLDVVATVIRPLRTQPEGAAKDAVREAKKLAVARINAKDRTGFLATLALVWLNLWGWTKSDAFSRALYGQATNLANFYVAMRTGSHDRPYNEASYTKLRSGEWGARIRHATNRQVTEGAFVLVTRKNNSTQLHSVTHVWWTDGDNTLVSLGDAPAQATQPNATVRQAIPIVREPAIKLVQEPTNESLESTLAGIGSESVTNATVQSAGSLSGGQLRGVGFATAEGYVTALRNGVKAATAQSYKHTLLGLGYTQEQVAALVVTVIPEATLPVGKGVTHAPSGTSFSDMTSAERRALMQNPAQAKAKAEAKAQESKARAMLIAGLVSSGRGIVVSPGRAQHGVARPASQLRAALAKIDRADLAPRLKSGKAQFGEVMQGLNGNGFRAWSVTRKDVSKAGEVWPTDVVSRWIVGTLDGGADLGKLGDKELVAELTRDGEIRFVGGSSSLRERLTREFEARVTEQSYNATDLLDWLRSAVAKDHHAIEWGGFWYVPGTEEQVKPVQDLIAAVKPLLGRSIAVGYVMSEKGLVGGLAESLFDEASKINEVFQDAQLAASERERAKALKDGKTEAEANIAAKRAVVLAGAAATIMKRCNEVAERIEGYAAMLGVECTKPARALVNQLRETVEPLCDDSSTRAAMLELD